MPGYLITFQAQAYDPGGKADVAPEDVAERNATLSASEVLEFRRAPVGAKWFAYYQPKPEQSRGLLTTWPGDLLAEVTWQGRPYKCPALYGSTSTRVNLRARDPVTGAEWAGTHYESSGDYVRLRRVR
jgi:hypothetical protein